MNERFESLPALSEQKDFKPKDRQLTRAERRKVERLTKKKTKK